MPQSFGKEKWPGWKVDGVKDSPSAVVMLRAAMLQHHCVVAMNEMRPRVGLDWEGVAERLTTCSYRQLMRVVRGESHLSMRLLSDLLTVFPPLLVMSETTKNLAQVHLDWPMYEPPDT